MSDNLWDDVLARVEGKINRHSFATWFRPTSYLAQDKGTLRIGVPNAQFREWLSKNYRGILQEALSEVGHAELTVIFEEHADEPAAAQPAAAVDRETSVLNPKYTFDSFVVGSSNQFAHAAARAVAEIPSKSYNPLFLYGSPGLGKTHLLVSIADYLRSRRPDLDVAYTTAERFTSEFVTALRGDGRPTERFKRRYRGVDVLLIDDVQFLEGKARTEDEFFHTFNELYAQGSQIVLSSDRPPEAMGRLSERMRDRFAWGLTVELQGPDPATRITLLRRLAVENGIPVPDLEVLQQIAGAAPGNLRRLEGALTRVTAFASMLGEAPSVDLVRKALGSDAEPIDATPVREPAAERLERIQRAVCDVLRLSLEDMRSPRRAPNLVRGRQLAMYVARNQTDLSLAEIARGFDRDHSTVIHSIRRVERDLEPGSDLHKALELIHERLHIAGEGA